MSQTIELHASSDQRDYYADMLSGSRTRLAQELTRIAKDVERALSFLDDGQVDCVQRTLDDLRGDVTRAARKVDEWDYYRAAYEKVMAEAAGASPEKG